ncbi:MAG TPA: hypothetical protein VFI24_20745 [Pyrinomonadaceae bacterium]|nr:hypothetical protein [Pyrinomonadaceae bacterium]
MNRASTEQVLNQAYHLAYFLHQDKGTAMRIVSAATLKLNVAMAAQSKRLYYVPVGRTSPGEPRRTDAIRNKALFSDLHLLQRLVYVESEPYERQKECAAQPATSDVHAAGDPASEEDLLVYFIKHLVRITTKRNSFYVTLGVSRLLHSYSTLETMEIYNAVIGEPERVKDDYYYRSRKAVLMHELYQRFGNLIRTCRHPRGEERFETQPGSSELRALMRECLQLFTPWDTQCHVPHDFDPLKSVIASLTSKSSADENEVEVSRIHAILHSDCFKRLVAAFGYSPPEERMELPRFFLEQTDDQSPPRQRSAAAGLSTEEVAELSDMLAEQAGRRRRSAPGAVVRVMVDGVERGRLNPAEQSSLVFSAAEDAEIIEVKTTDSGGELLLATHLLDSFKRDDHAIVSSIRLEGGQDLSLSITRRQIDASGGWDFLVTFGYRETDPRRAARLWWQWLGLRLSPEQIISPRPILVGSVVMIICLTGYLAYVSLNSQQIEPTQTASVQPANPPNVAAPTSTEPERNPPKKTRRIENTKPTKAPVEDQTRSGNVVANLKLSDVKKIYVDMRGDAALHDKVVESLNSSGVVAATGPDEADASLRITIGTNGIQAKLINARGVVLWSKTGRDTTVVKDLLSGIRLAK